MGIFSSSFFKMTCDRVDYAIQHTGLSLIKTDKICYFINKYGVWVGETYPVSVMEEYRLKDWIELAEDIVDRLKHDNKKN